MYYGSADTSSRILFDGLSIDATTGRYCMIIGSTYSYVTINDLALTQTDSGQALINWYEPDYVVIDGITAVGASNLQVAGYGTPTACEIKNGTFDGPAIGSVSGVTVTDVDLI
jgi:hypothetical protein